MFLTISVALVTYGVKKTTLTNLKMIRHLFDIIVIVSTDKDW